MAIWIGISMGLVFAAAGWAIYVYAPRVGRNPIFGVRTWYSMVSDEVWDRSNRTGGVLFAGLGVLMIVLTLAATPWIDSDSESGILAVVGLDLAITALGITWLVLYTRRLARGVPVARTGIIRVSPLWLLPGTVLTMGLEGFMVATGPSLPADSVATHFDAKGVADGWMSRSGHLWLSTVTMLGVFALLAGLFLVLTHVPIPGAKTWPIAGEPVMHFLAVMLLVVEGVMGVVFLDIYWFNTRQEHVLDMAALIVLIIGVVLVGTGAGLAYIIVYGRKLREGRT